MNRSQLINELATKTNLNKRDVTTILDAFTEMVAEKTNLNKRDVTTILDAFTEMVAEKTKAGDRVFIPGFGSFKPRLQTSRPARNPRNGDVIQLTPRTIVHFKCASLLIEKMNGK